MLCNLAEEHQLLTVVAGDLQDLDKLLEYVRAWPHSKLTRALERTVLLPLRDAALAEELPTVVAFHRLDRNL